MNCDKLKGARVGKSMTQEAMAKALGMTPVSYNRKENGKREFSRSEIEGIKNTLNLSISEINDIFFSEN